jgi:hypothetical protein
LTRAGNEKEKEGARAMEGGIRALIFTYREDPDAPVAHTLTRTVVRIL